MTREAPAHDIVYALAASPAFAEDGVCFAACQSGLYRSQDGGHTWQSAYDTLNLASPLPTIAVTVSPGFSQDQSVFAGVAGGILRSLDGGKRWLHTSLPSPPPLVSALVVSPDYANDGTLLVGTVQDGVFRSADRGSRWTAWNFGLLDLNVFCLAISPDFARDDTLYVGAESGVFRSTNGGRAWRETDLAMDSAPALSLALSPGYARDGTLFVGTESNGLWRSCDRGGSWEHIGAGALAGTVNAVILAPQFPAPPDILVVTDETLAVSRDGGETWSRQQYAGDAPQEGIVSVAAPLGPDPGAPLLLGLADGRILPTSVQRSGKTDPQ